MKVPIPALLAAATALLMAQAAHADPIGNPFASVDLVSLDESRNDAPPGVFRTSTEYGLPLSTAVYQTSGLFRRPGLAVGDVRNNGSTFSLVGDSPTYLGVVPRSVDTPAGSRGRLDIYQSYRRDSAAATMGFVYSYARLELGQDVELGSTCNNCILAEVGWSAEVYLNDASFTMLWSQSQNARLVDDNGVLTFNQPDPTQSGTGLVNPPWQWNCTRCGGTSFGLGEAKLQAPYRGLVDLSAIPFDSSLPAGLQPEFTVHYSMTMRVFDEGRWGNASAFTRDPLDPTAPGVGFEISDLTPTNNPVGMVPEPGTWALMLAGLAALGWRARQLLAGRLCGAAVLPLLLSAPTAQAQVVQTERYALARGNFIVGYRLRYDRGDENITRTDLQATDDFEVFDSGVVSGTQLGNPVYGIANFRAAAAHSFAPNRIEAHGSAEFYGGSAQPYVLVGGSASSNVKLTFTLDQPIEYTLIFDANGSTADPAELTLGGGFGYDSGANLHSFIGIGHWEVSGMLVQGDYSISGRATTNGSSQSGAFGYTLILGAVPEPSSWAMALAGLAVVGGLMQRRRLR